VDEAGLVATGERTAPGLPDEEYWFARHEAAYRWIADRLTAPGIVVDAGAGEGYGTAALPSLGPAIALEYDGTACTHMRRAYPHIAVVRANLVALPLRSARVDTITCLQVVEHLWDLRGFLRECHRTLRPGGDLIVTTPQRHTFSPGLGRGEKPLNPFHVEEFDGAQLRDLLADAGFEVVEMRGLHHGRDLADWEAAHGSIVAAQVDAAMTGDWPPHLRETVRQVTVDDFVIDPDPYPAESAHIARAQDLVAIGRVSPTGAASPTRRAAP
jgi:SAM-dependent methyltransferase